jgi:hypothetical protein
MAINGIIGFGGSLFGQAVQNLNSQLTDLSTQLATQKKATTYAGFGVNEGFAIAARSQLSDISAFTTTITNVNTVIDSANTALQSFSSIAKQVQSGAAAGSQNVTSTGQTIAQQNGLGQLTGLVGILNTQVGDRFIFSGSAIHTPAVATADTILNGTTTQAGLKQVIAERAQADGTTGLGRLVISPATSTPITISEDVAGSPFGLKLNSVSSTLTGATVTGPSGSPAAISISIAANPNPGDKVSITFNLPDGTTDSVQLTASNQSPLPSGSFAIGATPAQTSQNLNAALNTAIGTLANTSLVAASAVEAGHDFFDAGTATGGVANNQAATPAPITGATALSGAPGTDSLASGFAAGDTITVNGTQITFVASGATGNELNVTDSVQTLLSKIDSITGTSTPSTVSGGAITLHTEDAGSLSVTSSNRSGLASLGFASQPVTATQVPLRVSGSPPLSAATSLVSDSTGTVAWYTGNSSSSPRASSTARIDSNIVVPYGAQANEQAIRTQLEGVAVFAAVTVSPTATNTSATVAALSQRIAKNLTPQPGDQTIADIQTDFANAQNTMKEATDRQTQTQTLLQNIVDQTETASTQQVASEILALQTTLQASYETTSILAGLTLTKFLPPGG